MKNKCPFCEEEIDEEEIDEEDEVHKLLGEWSHIKCDEDKLEEIDKNIRHFY